MLPFLLIFLQVISSLVNGGTGTDSEPYTGEGVLRQVPPSPYYGGVLQYPESNKASSIRFYHSQTFTIKPPDGWTTTFTFMSMRMRELKDNIYITSLEDTGKDIKRIYHGTRYSQGLVFNTTARYIRVTMVLFAEWDRHIRVRWMSTPPETTVLGGYLTLDTYETGIPWKGSEVTSILLNLVADGGLKWQVDIGGRVQTLIAGVQILSNVSLPAASVLLVQPVNSSQNATELLLEWFPHAEDHIQVGASGCLSYNNQDGPMGGPMGGPLSWTLKSTSEANMFAGSSLRISFISVKAHSSDFVLKLMVDGSVYMVSRHSSTPEAIYYIPVRNTSDVTLTLSTSGPWTLQLCYSPDSETEFRASGYIRSEGFPELITAGMPTSIQGIPLPESWSLTWSFQQKIELELFRAWLDLILMNGQHQEIFLQSYTGLGYDHHKAGKSGTYDRYALTQTAWQSYYTGFGYIYGISDTEVVARFQSSFGNEGRNRFAGFGIKWNAQLQTTDEGIGTVYFRGDSGKVSSPKYPESYYSSATNMFDITILNTSLYNAVQLEFGDSYTELYKDVIDLWSRKSSGHPLIPVNFPANMRSGNMTGMVFTYRSTNVVLRFHSDETKEFQGFTVSWRGVYVDPDEKTTAYPSNTTTAPSIDTTEVKGRPTSDYPEYCDEELSSKAVGLVAGLTIVSVLLLTLLVAALAAIIMYRRQLSDMQAKGFFRPEYNAALSNDENGKIND